MLNKWLLCKSQAKHAQVLDSVCSSSDNNDINVEDFQNYAHETIHLEPNPNASAVSATIQHDLDIIPHDAIQSGGSVLDVFCKHVCTAGGRHVLHHILTMPINNVLELRQRQRALRALEVAISTCHPSVFSELKECEASLIWLHQVGRKKEFEQLFELMYFKLRPLRALNGVPLALTSHMAYRAILCPLMSALSPCLYVLVPFFVLRFKLKLRIPFVLYVRTIARALLESIRQPMLTWRMQMLRFASIITSILIYIQGIVNTLDLSRTLLRIDGLIGKHVVSGKRFLHKASQISDLLWNKHIASCFRMLPVHGQQQSDCEFNNNQQLGHVNSGYRLAWFKKFGARASNYSTLINKLYVLDALCAVVKTKTELNLCWPKYVRRCTQPLFAASNVKHINLISREACIGNSLVSHPRNVVITGPNAAGKTTFIKSACISVWLAQTLCVAPCDNLTLTPFHYIATHIHAPDVKGHASLFEAEMFRAKDTLSTISNLSQHQYAFLVFDEIFSSTNPQEGIAAAFAVLQTLGAQTQVISMTTTHYVHLCKLQTTNPDLFTNMRFTAIQNITGYDFSFRIERGFSNQQIALDLLSINGFDKDLVDKALRAKDETGFK